MEKSVQMGKVHRGVRCGDADRVGRQGRRAIPATVRIVQPSSLATSQWPLSALPVNRHPHPRP